MDERLNEVHLATLVRDFSMLHVDNNDFMNKIAQFVQKSKKEMNELTLVTEEMDNRKQSIGGLGNMILEKLRLIGNRDTSSDQRIELCQEMSVAMLKEKDLTKEVEDLATRKEQLLKGLEEKILQFKKSINAELAE